MASGQLESVRENRRVASAAGAALGGFLSISAVSIALALGAQPASQVAGIQFGSTMGATVSTLLIAAVLGAVIGGVQSAILHVYLSRQAEYFTPIQHVFRAAATRSSAFNGALACVAAIALLSGRAEWVYDIVVTLFIVLTTVLVIALLSWSHTADWPTRPAVIERRARQRTPFADGEEPVVDVRVGSHASKHRPRDRVLSDAKPADYWLRD